MMRYTENMIFDVIDDIEAVTKGPRSKDRLAIASVCAVCASIDKSVEPRPPMGLQQYTIKLRRKVSATCPSCVKPSVMLAWVEEAKKILAQYGKDLKKVHGVRCDQATSEKLSVHDLKPNL